MLLAFGTSLRKKRHLEVFCSLTHSLRPEGHARANQLRNKKKKLRTPERVTWVLLVAEMGFEPHDLRVMSPTSCQTAPLRDIMVPEAGVEPVREKISRDFKSRASANSAIPAWTTLWPSTLLVYYITKNIKSQYLFEKNLKKFSTISWHQLKNMLSYTIVLEKQTKT